MLNLFRMFVSFNAIGSAIFSPTSQENVCTLDTPSFLMQQPVARLPLNVVLDRWNYSDPTALYRAAKAGDTTGIVVLNAVGANVDLPDNEGCTPMCAAVRYGQNEAIYVLWALGADINKSDNEGRTPFFIAAQENRIKEIYTLFRLGADVNKHNNDGKTPVHIAAELDLSQVIVELKKANANMNTRDNQGITLLNSAIKSRNIGATIALLAAGATITEEIPYGKTLARINSVLTYGFNLVKGTDEFLGKDAEKKQPLSPGHYQFLSGLLIGLR